MQLEMGLTDFRGFNLQIPVAIRPLTILVGENSAGKSSFLAAYKYIHDTFGGRVGNFNADPFQLGTFEQISHNRGGRAGRARSFKIRLRDRFTPDSDEGDKSQEVQTDSTLTFGGDEYGTIVTGIEFRVGRTTLRLSFTADKADIEFKDGQGAVTKVGEDWLDYLSGDFSRSVFFLLSNLRYIIRGRRGETNGPPGLEQISMVLEELSSHYRRDLHASSAIRTKPLRTYTPGVESEDGEGSHVPFELAKLARRRNKSEWSAMREELASFGGASGMFQEIDVKSFGTTQSDPFQIQFSSNGPKRNIMDLGYGTSQVLPLLFDAVKSPGSADFLIQQPEVHLHPKAQSALAEFFIRSHLEKGQRFMLETHSDFIVDRLRMAVAEKRLAPDDVSILFFTRNKLDNSIVRIKLNDSGDPVSPPSSYRSFFVDEQFRMLGI